MHVLIEAAPLLWSGRTAGEKVVVPFMPLVPLVPFAKPLTSKGAGIALSRSSRDVVSCCSKRRIETQGGGATRMQG